MKYFLYNQFSVEMTITVCFATVSSDEGGNNVLLQKMIFSPEGHAEVELDLTGIGLC